MKTCELFHRHLGAGFPTTAGVIPSGPLDTAAFVVGEHAPVGVSLATDVE